MLTFHGTVRYVDGREEQFEAGMAALAAYEEYAIRHGYPYGEQMPPTLSALAVAWSCVARGSGIGFDKWRETVFGVEMEANGVPPTPPEATDGSA